MTTSQASLWDLQYQDSSFGEEKSSDCKQQMKTERPGWVSVHGNLSKNRQSLHHLLYRTNPEEKTQ
jgi:hypothetical protein